VVLRFPRRLIRKFETPHLPLDRYCRWPVGGPFCASSWASHRASSDGWHEPKTTVYDPDFPNALIDAPGRERLDFLG